MSAVHQIMSLVIAVGFLYGAYSFFQGSSLTRYLTLVFANNLLFQVFGVFFSVGNFPEPVVFTIYSLFANVAYLFIYRSFSNERWYRRIVTTLLLSIPISFGYVLWIYPVNSFPEELVSSFILIVTSLSISYYLVMLKSPNDIPLARNDRFWFNSANVVYWPLTFVHISLIDLIDGKPEFYWVPEMHNLMTILYYLSLLYCLHLSRKNRHEPERS